MPARPGGLYRIEGFAAAAPGLPPRMNKPQKTGTSSRNYVRFTPEIRRAAATSGKVCAIIDTHSYHNVPFAQMTSPVFDPEVVRNVTRAFMQATAARWPFPSVELQDRDTFMLIRVDVPPSDKHDIDLSVRQSIATALNEVVPVHFTQKFGHWIVAFLRDNKMVETVHPSEFQEL
jgi:hypothetical protein